MKLILRYILLIFAISAFIACNNDKLSKDCIVDNQWKNREETDLDKWISQRFSPYNIEVIYHWDKNILGPNTIAYPPAIDKIKPVLQTIETLFIGTFTDSKLLSQSFLKSKSIIRFILLGSYSSKDGILLNLYESDASTNEFFIYGVNDFDINDPNKVKKLLYSVYHQFALRLAEAVPYDRKAFADLSASVYGSMGLRPDEKELHKRWGLSPYANRSGFYTLHSMSNPDDDFAQIVASLLLYSPVDISNAEEIAARAEDDSFEARLRAKEAKERMVAKRNFVQSYFKEKLGFNIRKLQLINLSNIDKFIKQHR